MLAWAIDTFVLEGVVDFKLRVLFDDSGQPSALKGLYRGGRTDLTPRNS